MSSQALRYAMVIQWSDEDQVYVVTVPELPGCRTHGASYADAARNGEDVMALWLQSRQETGRPIPIPRSDVLEVATDFSPEVQWGTDSAARLTAVS